MLEKICKYLSFGAIAVLVAYMAAMTVLEKFSGTAAAMEWGYHSAVFIALWAVAAVAGTAFYLVEGKIGKNSIANPVSGIHLAFVFILSGALVTHIFGVQGALHLRLEDGEVREFTGDDMESRELPFAVSLADFEIRYYPGTYAPVDYTSTLEITDGDAGPVELSVSMNSPAVYRGYRFYQSSYDEDTRGSTLAVSHDPAGIAVTYTGYALLLLSLAGYFFRKDSGFRRLLARIAGRAAVWLSVPMLLCGAAPDMSAKEASGVPDHLPEETAAEYGRMYIYYNDRVCPVQTLARDFTLKLYGKSSYMGLSPEQVLTGWIFYYDSWKNTVPEESEAASPKARKKIGDRRQAVMLVRSASILKLFPYRDGAGEVTWYSPVDRLPAEMDADQWLFVRKVMSLAGESVAGKDFDSAGEIFSKISEYQKKTASGELPPESRIAAERLYNTVERPGTAAMVCLSAGLVLFILYCLFSNLGKPLRIAAAVLSGAAFLYLTLVLGLRWYVSVHVPMSNGFEVMMLLAWHTLMLGTLIQRKFPIILPFAFLLGGFALLVASIGESDPAIAWLTPVLSSPLLSVHVMAMMISYTLLGLAMLNSVMAIVKYGRNRNGLSESADFSLLFLYPAVFCLAAGTFLGAVWANVSWGRYWAWDPKEVWALITLLVYSFALHGKVLKPFRDPLFLHVFCILAFLCVIVTYFGVNFFLGGLHSYA